MYARRKNKKSKETFAVIFTAIRRSFKCFETISIKNRKNERLLNNRKLSMLISKYNINVNYILTGKGSIFIL